MAIGSVSGLGWSAFRLWLDELRLTWLNALRAISSALIIRSRMYSFDRDCWSIGHLQTWDGARSDNVYVGECIMELALAISAWLFALFGEHQVMA